MAKILTVYDNKEYITNFEKECNDTEADFAAKVAIAYSETAYNIKTAFHQKVESLLADYSNGKINPSEYKESVNKVLTEAQDIVVKLGKECGEAFNNEFFGEENSEDNHNAM